jgi:isopropylmalate/homocitrate/citramalate synthase
MTKNNHYKENMWWASPYNDYSEVVDKINLASKVELHDATLRDGEQTPGVVFSIDDKIRIAEKLNEVGVERIEAGMPAVSKDDYKAIKSITGRKLDSKIFTFARAMRQDIDMALETGAHGVVIEVPIGYPKLKYQFNWTWENVLEKSVDCINYAKSQGLYTVYFPYDTTRAREEDLTQLIKGIMVNSPPDSVGVVDTMGCALPQTIEYLVRKMKKLTNGLPVEIHTHNDFGMAVATEIAGISAGASVAHTCINGLGERTGNAALEELMVAITILLGIENGYRLDKMLELSQMVEQISGVPLATNKPIAGIRNYTRESGIGIDLVMKNPLAMFATDPQLFGRTGEIVLGKKSGKASVEYFLDKLGIEVPNEVVTEILNEVKAMGTIKKRILALEEFQEIVVKYQ